VISHDESLKLRLAPFLAKQSKSRNAHGLSRG
jgi:hypothetical protein